MADNKSRGLDIIVTDAASEHEDGVWFSPDFLDNLDREECDRFAVCIRPLTARQFQSINFSTLIKSKGSVSRDPVALTLKRENVKREKILKSNLIEARNFFVKEKATGERREIKSGEELISTLQASASAAHTFLLDQIYSAIIDDSVLAEGLLGK